MSRKILVAEDDAIVRSILKQYLSLNGFVVIEEPSGLKVRERVLEHKPEACLIDIIMDVKEGIETIEEILSLPDRPKIIAISSDSFYLSLALELGADAILQKPIEASSLQETLKKLEIFN